MSDPVNLDVDPDGDYNHSLCGTLVMTYDHRIRAGEMVSAVHATNADGTPSLPGQVLWCSACDRPVDLAELTETDG